MENKIESLLSCLKSSDSLDEKMQAIRNSSSTDYKFAISDDTKEMVINNVIAGLEYSLLRRDLYNPDYTCGYCKYDCSK